MKSHEALEQLCRTLSAYFSLSTISWGNLTNSNGLAIAFDLH